MEVHFGFQRPSLTFRESNLGHLVHFKLLTVDYRPLSFNFGHMEINIVLCQLTILQQKSILGIILDLWESILESGSLFRPLRYNFMPLGGIFGPIGFKFWPLRVDFGLLRVNFLTFKS